MRYTGPARTCAAFLLLTALPSAGGLAAQTTAPEARAIAFLAAEVPKWQPANNCYSCHNNGDAARALMQATKSRDLKDPLPLKDTLRFLSRPEAWDANGPDGPFKDKKLARIQFAAALAEAHRAGLIADRAALVRGAALVAELQTSDGSWETDAPGNVGSPVTYGRALATTMGLRTLLAADAMKFRAAIDKAIAWFESTKAQSVLDAAATLLALADVPGEQGAARRAQCLELIRRGQSADGGWGPFVNAPPESFDTALVLLALAAQRNDPVLARQIEHGRKYLLAAQEPDGGWPPTTRPSGVDSYAQRLSTTGWATQALLATRAK